MNTGKLVLGALAGFAAGALLGVLLAPDKGSETRKKITRKGKETVDNLKDKFEDMLNDITEKFESVKEEVADGYDNVKSKVDQTQKDSKLQS